LFSLLLKHNQTGNPGVLLLSSRCSACSHPVHAQINQSKAVEGTVRRYIKDVQSVLCCAVRCSHGSGLTAVQTGTCERDLQDSLFHNGNWVLFKVLYYLSLYTQISTGWVVDAINRSPPFYGSSLKVGA
jgi:hypothetical protein